MHARGTATSFIIELLPYICEMYLHGAQLGGLHWQCTILVNAGATAGRPASDAVDDVEEFALELSSEAGHGSD